MKPKSFIRSFRLGSALTASSVLLVAANTASAVDYYWNQNSTGAGWGAGGVWDATSAVFTAAPENPTGTAVAVATGTGDTLNFGSSTTGFGGGNITFTNNQSIGSLVTGSANTAGTALVGFTRVTTLASVANITNNSSFVFDIQNSLAGAATSITVNDSGAGVAFSTGSSTYTGLTNVNSGLLLVNNIGNLGTTGTDANRTNVASGATVRFNNDVARTFQERFVIAGTGVGGTGGALANTTRGAVTATVSGRVNLSAAATTFAGSGTLSFTGGLVLDGNALTFNSTGSGAQTVATTAISSTGSGSVIKTGGGTLNLNIGTSSYTGGTTLNAGTINIGAAISGSNSALGSTSGQLTVNGGTLNMAGNNVTVGNLTGSGGIISGTSGTRTLTIGQGNTGGGDYQGQINDGTGGTTILTKTGNATITLSGTNGYTGATNVSQGTLLINGSTSATSTVNVSAGAILGGNGRSFGAVNVTGSLSPGSSIETFGTGTVSFANGSTLVHELNSSVATSAGSDLLKVTGDLNLAGTVGLNLSDLAVTDVAFADGTIFSLINYTGSWNSGLFSLGVNELADEEVFTFGLNMWRISYNDATGGSNYIGEYAGGADSFVNLTAVPEPRAALLGGLGLLMLLYRRRLA